MRKLSSSFSVHDANAFLDGPGPSLAILEPIVPLVYERILFFFMAAFLTVLSASTRSA
jgi:hypothetical protein